MRRNRRQQFQLAVCLAAILLSCASCGSQTAKKFDQPSDLPFTTRVWPLSDDVQHLRPDGDGLIVLSCGSEAATLARFDNAMGSAARPAFQTFHLDEGFSASLDAGFALDSQHAWAVGGKGVIMATVDGGASWMTQESDTDADLNGIVFADSQRGCAVGDNGTLLVTTNGGVSWARRKSGTEVNLTLAHFVDSDVILAGGARGTLLRTTDAGNSWMTVVANLKGAVRSVSFLSTKVGFLIAAGTDLLGRRTELFVTENGGATWMRRSEVPELLLSAVQFLDAQKGWCVGEEGVIVRTLDGGQTWQRLDSGVESDLTAVRFITTVRGWASGKRGTVLTTDDGGVTWRRVKGQPNGNFRAVAAGGSGRPWLLTSLNTNITDVFTVDGADDKPSAKETQVTQSIEALHFVSDSTGWAAANTEFAYQPFPGDGSILATKDGGKTWMSQVTKADAAFKNLQFVDGTHGWAVGGRIHDLPFTFDSGRNTYTFIPNNREPGGYPEGVVLSTADGGKNWRRQETNLDCFVADLSFINERKGWIIGYTFSKGSLASRMYGSDDGGVTWRMLHSEGNVQFHSIRFFDDKHGIVVGIAFPVLANVILHTSDGGNTWNKVEANYKHPLGPCHWVDAMNGWAVAGRVAPDVIVSTADGGKTWTERHSVNDHILINVRFAGPTHGWAVGAQSQLFGRGVIAFTADGGKTWQNESTPRPIKAVAHSPTSGRAWFAGNPRFVEQSLAASSADHGLSWMPIGGAIPLKANLLLLRDQRVGFAFGSQNAARTHDVATTWQRLEIPSDAVLEGAYFVTDTSGWVVGEKGLALKTEDSGKTWMKRPTDSERTLKTISFPDLEHGWAAGENGLLLTTTNGGASWQKLDTKTKATLHAVHARGSGKRFSGWAVGSNGVILGSNDGRIWKVQPRVTDVTLRAVAFFNDRVGWAVGDDGTVLTTTDGVRWARMKKACSETLSGIVVEDTGDWLAVGEDTLLLGVRDNSAPWLSEFSIREIGNRLAFSGRVRDESPDQVVCESIEFRPKGKAEWRKVKAENEPTVSNGELSCGWNPSGDILPGTVTDVRVTLRDAQEAVYTQEVMMDVTYLRWWDRQEASTKAVLGASGAVSLYLITCLILLVAQPTALIWLSAKLPGEPPADAGGTSAWVRVVVRGLFALLGPAAFARHGRVRRRWAAIYRAGGGKLEDLPEAIRGDYLKEASVIQAWAHRYAGRSEEWENVPELARLEFLKYPEVLDAWVERHIGKAREALHQARVRLQITSYVPLPVQLDSLPPSEPTADVLRRVFQKVVNRVLIWGEGGIGKTSLALAIADRAMSDNPSDRPFAHRSITVVVEGVPKGMSLEQAVSSLVRSTIDCANSTATDLHAELFRQRRILVLIDGLSEFDDGVVRAIAAELAEPSSSINALLVTSRQPNLPDPLTAHSLMRPLPIAADRLRTFLDSLLNSARDGVALTDDQFNDVRCRLRDLVSEHSVTPLLVRIFADQAIAAVKANSLAVLPQSIPEMMLQYVKRLNNPRSGAPRTDATVYTDLMAIAWAAFTKSQVIQSISREEAIEALAAVDAVDPGRRLDELLQGGMGVLQEVGLVPGQLKFILDPLAEFFACFHAFREYQSDRRRWTAFLARLDKMPNRSATIKGVCGALAATLPVCENTLHVRLTPECVTELNEWLQTKLQLND